MGSIRVQVEHLSKAFNGQIVLKDISIELQTGKIYGLIGRNGSGKTVLMKCICGFLQPTSGCIKIDGVTLENNDQILDEFGIIIEAPGFLPNYSAFKNLTLLSMIRGTCSKDHIKDVIRLVGLDPDSPKKVKKYSMGMKQRLGIAQAIMENPNILILDEPMNGLDNQGVLDIRKLILSLRDEGKLILLATHNREDIESLCDEVYEMDAGILSKRKSKNIDVYLAKNTD